MTKPLANKDLLPGRDMEPVLLCWHNSHETKNVIQGSGARSQQTKFSFFSLLLAVGVREKKSDFANTGIRKTAVETNCYPKKWPWGHGTFADLSFHVSFGCRYLILLLHPGFWHSFDSVYTWIILFSQERSSKLLQKRLCPSKTSLLIFCPCGEWYIQHALLIHELLNIFDLTHALSLQCPVEKVYWVLSSPLRHKCLI